MNNNIVATITKLLLGVWYFTESESPFKAADWGKITSSELLKEIAIKYNADPSNLKQIDQADFFDGLISNVDQADAPMVENAGKIADFYTFLKQNLSNITVVRVEGASRIPVLIAGYLTDGTCIVIETFAIET